MMRKITTILFILCIVAMSATQGYGQKPGTLVADSVNGQQMLLGSFHKSDLTNNPDFSWYETSRKIYPTANAEAVRALKENQDKIHLIIFAGTWCEDTHFVLPKFFKIQEAANFPESRIALFALDRSKKMPNPIAEALNVKDVPTIIVMKDGKELGRVIEYGKTGYWDKELAEVITPQ